MEVNVDLIVVLFIIVKFFLGCSLNGWFLLIFFRVFIVVIDLFFLVIVLEFGCVVKSFVDNKRMNYFVFWNFVL